jgi:ribonuclease HI
MVMKSLFVYTDSSMRGEWCVGSDGRAIQRKRGQSMAAWVGWEGGDLNRVPDIAGKAYLGCLPIQRAEYGAVIYGLHAALTYVNIMPNEVTDVLIYSDNRVVVGTLAGRMSATVLKPCRAAARYLQGQLEGSGVGVHFEEATSAMPPMGLVHRMSQDAHNQVLERRWRAPGKRAGKRAAVSGPSR